MHGGNRGKGTTAKVAKSNRSQTTFLGENEQWEGRCEVTPLSTFTLVSPSSALLDFIGKDDSCANLRAFAPSAPPLRPISSASVVA